MPRNPLPTLLLLLALLPACANPEDQETRLIADPLARPHAVRTLDAGGDADSDPGLPTSPEDLAVALPEFSRRQPYRWDEPNTLIPGHLSNHLIAREGRKTVAVVIIEDIVEQPERAARFNTTAERVGRWPAASAPNDWLRVLVADRFLVEVRATRDTHPDDALLREWMDLLKLDKLAALAPPKPPPLAPASSTPDAPPELP